MAVIPHIYKDAGLLEAFDDAVDTIDAFAVNGDTGDGVFYVGTATAANMLQDETSPGVADIVASIADASPGGGVEVAHIKLALTAGGLASAVAGDPLNLGTSILGGAGGAVAVHFRWANSVGAGNYTEISIGLTSRIEVAQ